MLAPRPPEKSAAHPGGHISVPLAHRDEQRLGWRTLWVSVASHAVPKPPFRTTSQPPFPGDERPTPYINSPITPHQLYLLASAPSD